MLREAGVTTGQLGPDAPRRVIDAFREFALTPVTGVARVDEDGDGVLAQFGTDTFSGPRLFRVDLTRQFIKPGNDPAIWQLSCSMTWPRSPETDVLGAGNLWSFGIDASAFFRQVESLAGFQWALTSAPPPDAVTVALERV